MGVGEGRAGDGSASSATSQREMASESPPPAPGRGRRPSARRTSSPRRALLGAYPSRHLGVLETSWEGGGSVQEESLVGPGSRFYSGHDSPGSTPL